MNFSANWFEQIYGQGQQAMVKCTATLVRLFRPNEIKDHPNKKDRAGNPLQYLDTPSVIDRLNEAFTALGWSFVPGDPIYPPTPADKPHIVPHQVAVLGILTVHTPWGDITKSQYGSGILKALWDKEAPDGFGYGGKGKFGTDRAYNLQANEFGDDLKGAASDALKKCATLVGVGNYISRKGTAQVPASAGEVLGELANLAKEKGLIMTYKVGEKTEADQTAFLEFCGGVVRKTVRGAADLSLVQAQACLTILRDYPAIAKQLAAA